MAEVELPAAAAAEVELRQQRDLDHRRAQALARDVHLVLRGAPALHELAECGAHVGAALQALRWAGAES